MTLAAFAIAAGADPKWVQNAARLLGWDLAYTAAEALHMGLVKRLQDELGVPLERAAELTARALAGAADAVVDAGSLSRVNVDVARYRSDAAVRLAQALSQYAPRRRGRPVVEAGGAVARARRYGWDIGLLEASLRATPEERLRRLDQNAEFIATIRRGRR